MRPPNSDHGIAMLMKFYIKLGVISVCLLTLSACSLNTVSIRLSSFFIEHKIAALNSEKDLSKVKRQLPKNIALLEKLLAEGKPKKKLHIYAAQAYYSYAFAFIEDSNKKQAVSLYSQSHQHARAALSMHGIPVTALQGSSLQLKKSIASLPKEAADALYWAAVSWAKLIEIKQPDLFLFAQLHKTAILMEQVIKLDKSYQLGGAYLFFAVYYGSRAQYLGGNDVLAGEYFERARSFNRNRLLIVDFLQAKYLKGRVSGKAKLKQRLKRIIKAPDDLYPEQSLMNAVAKQKASRMLTTSHS